MRSRTETEVNRSNVQRTRLPSETSCSASNYPRPRSIKNGDRPTPFANAIPPDAVVGENVVAWSGGASLTRPIRRVGGRLIVRQCCFKTAKDEEVLPRSNDCVIPLICPFDGTRLGIVFPSGLPSFGHSVVPLDVAIGRWSWRFRWTFDWSEGTWRRDFTQRLRSDRRVVLPNAGTRRHLICCWRLSLFERIGTCALFVAVVVR